ncbi:MAG: hypothetical protein ABWW65_05515 [Thermoprotei archaeon]
MYLEVAISTAIIAAVITSALIDYFTESDITPISILVGFLVSLLFGLTTTAVLVLLILVFSRLLGTIITIKKTAEWRDLLIYLAIYLINPVLYLIIGVALGIYFAKHSLPYMSTWSSAFLSLLIIALILSISIGNTLDKLSFIGYWLMTKIPELINALYWFTVFLMFLSAILAVLIHGYIAVPLLIILVFTLFLRREIKNNVYKNALMLIYPITAIILLLAFT